MTNGQIHTDVNLQKGHEHHTQRIRETKEIKKPKRTTKYFGSASTTIKSINAFNNLPEAIRKLSNTKDFKKELSNLIIRK
jgi:hypothetical protein